MSDRSGRVRGALSRLSGRQWFLIRRFAWMVITAWVVLTLAFLLFAYTPDPNIALVKFAAGFGAAMSGGDVVSAQRRAVEAYIQLHNYDVPPLQRYVKWMTNYATLHWGRTLGGEPVTKALADSLVVTFTYLLPALAIASVVGVGAGLYVATHRGGVVDYAVTSLSYAGYGVPLFFAGEMLFALLVSKYGMVWLAGDKRVGLYTAENIVRFLLPWILMTGQLLAIQLVFVRSEVIDSLQEEFTKTLTASGAGTRDLARHALRNAALPLVSEFFAEILTVLYVSVIVIEVVFGLPGYGRLTFGAIKNRDIALILGTTLVPLFVGIVGNFLQDVAYAALDPRIDYEDR